MAAIHQVGHPHTDLNSLLEREHGEILEKLDELEKLAGDIDRIASDDTFYINLFRLNNRIYTQLIRQFNTEEDCLYRELRRVVPDPAPLLAMENEHLEILKACNEVQNSLGDEEVVKSGKDELRKNIRQLAGRIRENIDKDDSIVHHDATELLEPEVRDYVYYEMVKSAGVRMPR